MIIIWDSQKRPGLPTQLKKPHRFFNVSYILDTNLCVKAVQKYLVTLNNQIGIWKRLKIIMAKKIANIPKENYID